MRTYHGALLPLDQVGGRISFKKERLGPPRPLGFKMAEVSYEAFRDDRRRRIVQRHVTLPSFVLWNLYNNGPF